MAEHTPLEVAEWMEAQVRERGYLEQHAAVQEIESLFGEEFIEEKGATRGVAARVLRKFNQLTGKSIVYARLSKHWRLREPGMNPDAGSVTAKFRRSAIRMGSGSSESYCIPSPVAHTSGTRSAPSLRGVSLSVGRGE